MNDIEGWGEDGIGAKLINIATTIDEPTIAKVDVDGQEQLLRYYVEEPTSLGIIEDTRTKSTLDYIVNLCEPTNAYEGELFHSKKAPAPICFQNLLSLSHLPTRKTRGKELLINYINPMLLLLMNIYKFCVKKLWTKK
jgi:hypothetical protein